MRRVVSTPSVEVGVDNGASTSDSVSAQGSNSGWQFTGGVSHTVSTQQNDGTTIAKTVQCDGVAVMDLNAFVNTPSSCFGQGADMITAIGPNTLSVYAKGIGRIQLVGGYDGEGFAHIHPVGGQSRNYILVRASGSLYAKRLDTGDPVKVRYNTLPNSEYRLTDVTPDQ